MSLLQVFFIFYKMRKCNRFLLIESHKGPIVSHFSTRDAAATHKQTGAKVTFKKDKQQA